jgi:hypothetical protein
MMLDLEYHPEMLLITPALGITYGDCAEPGCAATHWRVSFGWLVWSIHLIF